MSIPTKTGELLIVANFVSRSPTSTTEVSQVIAARLPTDEKGKPRKLDDGQLETHAWLKMVAATLPNGKYTNAQTALIYDGQLPADMTMEALAEAQKEKKAVTIDPEQMAHDLARTEEARRTRTMPTSPAATAGRRRT